MARWWSIPALIAAPVVCHLGAAPAAATIHCNVSIIMTTLGTDGAPTVYSGEMTLTPTSTDVVTAATPGSGTVSPAGGITDPTKSTDGTAGSMGGSGAAMPTAPSGASSDPAADSGVIPVPSSTGDADSGVIPVPSSTGDVAPSIDEGPVPPAPPVLDPTVVSDVPTTPTDVGTTTIDSPVILETVVPVVNENLAETPEPGTLTLMGLGLAGGFGYFRRKRS